MKYSELLTSKIMRSNGKALARWNIWLRDRTRMRTVGPATEDMHTKHKTSYGGVWGVVRKGSAFCSICTMDHSP